jgi:hypothetical protein
MGTTRLGFGRRSLGIGLAVVLLAGCGGQSAGPGTMPQGATVEGTAHRGSWMRPGTSGSDLLYVSSYFSDDVYVYSYPAGSLVGTLTGFSQVQDMCSDQKGNVWIANDSGGSEGAGEMLEYAHGGTSPIATLNDTATPIDCSVDAKTGNLAVANSSYRPYGINLAIYVHAQGTPTYYNTKVLPISCSYDNRGNLFVQGQVGVYSYDVTWLPKGTSQFRHFKRRPFAYSRYGVQWDGKYVAIAASGDTDIYQYTLRNGIGRQVGHTHINGGVERFWIQGSTLLSTEGDSVFFWPYPGGGSYTKEITGPSGSYALFGVTVSVAPLGSRIRK